MIKQTSSKYTMTVSYELYEAGEFTFPAKFEVCDRCNGHGKHVNPSIDGNGISQEEFDEDPEFREAYFAGAYDIPCECCHGDRVVLVPNESSFSKEDRENWKIVDNALLEQYKHLQYCAAERRMGA